VVANPHPMNKKVAPTVDPVIESGLIVMIKVEFKYAEISRDCIKS